MIKKFLHPQLLLALSLMLAMPAFAQAFPSRPVRFVIGFLAPAGTPKDVVTRLSEAFRQVLSQPEIRNRMVSQGADPAFLGADESASFLSTEMPRWAAAVKASGAKLD